MTTAPIPRRLARIATTFVLLAISSHAALTRRLRQLDRDRGDIPGWAIAAGASVVFGLLVWAAVNGVVGSYITKINSGGK